MNQQWHDEFVALCAFFPSGKLTKEEWHGCRSRCDSASAFGLSNEETSRRACDPWRSTLCGGYGCFERRLSTFAGEPYQ